MSKADEIVKIANTLVSTGWRSPVDPGCAAFTSEVMERAGVSLQGIANRYWVPDLVAEAIRRHGTLSKPVPGGIVVLDQTYDAENPPGVGPEDTMTHVGVYLGENKSGVGMAAHYSSGAPRIVPITRWDNLPIHYYSLIDPDEAEKNVQKIQIWGKQGRIALKMGGKTYEPSSIYMEIVM